ncbi:MAG TPA: polyprenyl synthetase family protein [Xanthomonadaceae bacterium]|nr:polyprenyl synthetase family protein [Xanthomonadaceae bacterium]
MKAEFPAALRALAERSETVLESLLPAPESPPQRLHQAMRYAVLGNGKRMRPLLVYATGTLLGAPLEALDRPAAAVELIHAYSLIHDDLPAMDDDDLRRGRPTCHKAFDEATAILAGDALQCLAFEVLLESGHADAVRLQLLHTLALSSGTRGMAGGQAIDIAATGRRLDPGELETMHRMKTGALIRAAVRLGAIVAAAGAAEAEALDRFADALGLAFQIRDDLLDVEGTAAGLGKTAGKDARSQKPTYPSVLGTQEARLRLQAEAERMRSALDGFGWGDSALADLAHVAAGRTH